MLKRTSLIVLLSSCFSVANAQQIMCPGGTHFISIGDSINDVIAQCGQPQARKKIAAKHSQTKVAWYYELSQQAAGIRLGKDGIKASAGSVVNNRNNQLNGSGSQLAINSKTTQTRINSNGSVSITTLPQSTVRWRILFVGNKASEITQANPSSKYRRMICPHGNVDVGASMSTVSNLCGLPVFQQRLGGAATKAQPAHEQLTFQAHSYLPAHTLTFVKGKLVAAH